MAASYAIITCPENLVTTVILRPSCLERFDRQREYIADPPLGLDHARRTRIDLKLAPQPQYLDIDASIKNILVNPGSLQQMLARQRPLRRFEERQQQRILALAQRDRRPI